jgi:UDP-N-acetyl-2-amino-2-deoxyglucuronate dehydrogenase
VKRFALTGVAGFVAPRHLKAIKETGNELVAAIDKSDSAGILDHYFPKAEFFTEFETFERFLRKQERTPIDYFSICTPNHLHNEHIRFALGHEANVICEKPIVLYPEEAYELLEVQTRSGREVFNVLQLRLHPSIVSLRNQTAGLNSSKKSDIDLAYVTPRGNWYHSSWKGDIKKSGGIATNIGIHFFDMLIWIFGKVQNIIVHLHEKDRAAGFLELERARVRWFLSINEKDIPVETKLNGEHSSRFLAVDGNIVDFTNGFADLHTKTYEGILAGNGFGLAEALPSIELVHAIRAKTPVGLKGDVHPMTSLITD